MALQTVYTFHGVVIPAAYITLTRPVVDKFNQFVAAEFRVYASHSAYLNGEQPFDSVSFNERIDPAEVDWGTIGTWGWAYTKLKSLPEFADAIDV